MRFLRFVSLILYEYQQALNIYHTWLPASMSIQQVIQDAITTSVLGRFNCMDNEVLLPAATKLGQGNIFTDVCLSTGGGVSASVHAGIYLGAATTHPLDQTPPEQTPLDQTPPPRTRPSPRSRPPGEDTPLEQTLPPPEQTPPRADPPPPREADFSIRSTSGRYASYWNAFLFI